MTPEETRAVLDRLYGALTRRDGEAMAACYAKDAVFEDEVFLLKGDEVGRMWKALMGRAKEFSASYTIAQAGSGKGVVEWTARYRYGANPVVNVILSELELANGLVVKQTDTFDFPRWASQALGFPGKLFGGMGWFRRAVSKKAAAGIGVPPKP